ncbi:MAG: hypothetical protein K2Z81_22985, partial [Cyanobacteria bacterium]|nr:hypothetical protein [Cyanobacteriota bacterium]
RRLASPGNEKLGEQLFGTSDRNKWPEPVRKLVESWTGAAKNVRGEAVGWNEANAREILNANMNERLLDINGQRHRLYTIEYRAKLHESEAHYLTYGVEEKTAGEQVAALAHDARAEQTTRESLATGELLKVNTSPDTTRTLTDYSGKDATAEALILSAKFHAGAKYTNRSSLDRAWSKFDASARRMLDKGIGRDEATKVEQLNDLVRKFAAQVPELANDPLMKNAKIVADPTLSEGGKLVFTHNGAEIKPTFHDGTHAFVRGESGEITKIPLSEIAVEMRVSRATLEAAETAGGKGNMQASEVVSTVYHQLHQVDQLRTRAQRAKNAGVDLESRTTEPLVINHFLATESAASRTSADYTQYRLNGNSVDGKTFVHSSITEFDLKKPIAEMTGERVVTSVGADGRLRIYVINSNKNIIGEVSEKQAEELIEKSFGKLIKAVDEKIEKAKQEKNAEQEAELRKQKAKLEGDLKRYKTEPEFRKALNGRLGRLGSTARAGLGIGVTVLFLTTTVLDLYRKESNESDIDLNIPIHGS